MLRIILTAFLFSLTIANPVTFTDCGNKEVLSVDVTECTASPCTLAKGKAVHLLVKFTANEDSATAVMHVVASLAGILEVEVPGVDPDACKGHLTCPIKLGQQYSLNYTVTVPPETPTIEADIIARLIGDKNKVLACGKVHGSIK